MLLTRLPLLLRGARLACVKPAASVRSEPGSNSQVENSIMTDHYVLNRREHFYMYTSASLRRFHRSHSKRDRHLSSNWIKPKLDPRKPADHVSLSSHIQLSKNRHPQTRKLENVINHRAKPEPGPISISANFSAIVSWISPERRTSSLAAPPPSSVSGLIEDTPPKRQQARFHFLQKNDKRMILLEKFRFPSNLPVFSCPSVSIE